MAVTSVASQRIGFLEIPRRVVGSSTTVSRAVSRFSRSIYEHFEDVAQRAHDLIVDCSCGRDEGCPACTMDDRCGNDNRPLYSPAAADVLEHLLGDQEEDDLNEHLPETDGEVTLLKNSDRQRRFRKDESMNRL